VFERFTEQARRTVVLAQESARVLSHNYLGTEHLLLGLLRHDGGVAHKALDLFDVTLQRAQYEVEQLVGRGTSAPGANIPFTASAKQALERSQWESRQLRHDHIGTEHLLLGLVRPGDNTAVRVLQALEINPEVLRTAVMQLVDGGATDQAGEIDTVPFESETDDRDDAVTSLDAPARSGPVGVVEDTEDVGLALQVARLTSEVQALRAEIARLAGLIEAQSRQPG